MSDWKNIINKNLGGYIPSKQQKEHSKKRRKISMSLDYNIAYLKHLKQLLSNKKQKDNIAEITKEIKRVESQIDYLKAKGHSD